MTSSLRPLTCANCKNINPPDARYCQRCGEAVAHDLVAQLQRDYTVLAALNAAIRAGDGAASVQVFHDKVLARYLAQRAARPAAAPVASTDTSQPASQAPVAPGPASITPVAPPVRATAAAPVAQPQPPIAPVPHGPVFSWRAFIADQAIAIMAYLGGFLLLIATLTFEVGGWSALPELAKLAGVTLVYLVFGALGIGLRRFQVLRTVSRVYLGVFALMTPLEGLAVYLFGLQQQGFPVEGMICLASGYAAIIYLALGVRTRFTTYAYLGWSAALAAIGAIPLWAQAQEQWTLAALALGALALLAPRALATRRGGGAVAWLSLPAMWISGVVATMSALLGFGLLVGEVSQVAVQSSLQVTPNVQAQAANAMTCLALTALAVAWSFALRTLERPAPWEARSFVAWLAPFFAAMSACALAIALGATLSALAYTLAAVALVEGGLVLVWRSRLEALRCVALGTQGLTMALAVLATMFGLGAASPAENYALMAACAAGLALGAVYAARGTTANAALWGIGGGVFLLLGAASVFETVVPASRLFAVADDSFAGAALEMPSLYVGLCGLLALAGVALRYFAPERLGVRNLRVAAFTTALLGSLVTCVMLPIHTATYATVILSAFGTIALGIARIERWPLWAGLVAGGYGTVAAFAFVATVSSGLILMLVAPLIALAALGWYWTAGRAYALPVYVVALVAVVSATARLAAQSPPGIPDALARFTLGPVGQMALAVALLMAVAALRERSYLWQIAPAGVSLLSVFAANDLWPLVAITLILAGAGALAHGLRGQRWGIPWHGAALLASVGALYYAFTGAHGGPVSVVAIALIFLVVAWLVTWQEQMPWLSAIAVVYALVALLGLPALPLPDLPVLSIYAAFTLGAAGLGALARLLLGRPWALALYASAALGSAFTVVYAEPRSALTGYLLALALTYAAVSWLIAWLERIPWISAGAVAYALVALLSVSTLALGAIPILLAYAALTLTGVGLGALARGRLGRPWALAPYTCAALGSGFTAAYALPRLELSGYLLATALIYGAVAWLIARWERVAWLTALATPFVIVACIALGQLQFPNIYIGLGSYIALTLIIVGLGALARARLGRPWALALYGMAVIASLFPLPNGLAIPDSGAFIEGALLIYAAAALGIALIEDSSAAVLAPALYAAGAALVQPDGRALLPLALGLAVAAYIISRTRGGVTALPLYGSAVVAAIASSWQGQAIPAFEPIALGVLALAAWAIAALESRPEGLILAYVFAGLTIPAAGRAFGWDTWAVELALVGLAWVVALSGLAWARIPWLRAGAEGWLLSLSDSPAIKAVLRDTRGAGSWVSRGAALLLGVGVVVAGALAPHAFATMTPTTLIEVVALVSLTGLLLFEGAQAGWRLAMYVAIETAALAITWQLRWFGADNPQAWVVGPGSAQILIGALLPADTRVHAPRWLGQAFSVGGALVLMIPTLTQSVTEPQAWQWVYALVLALEALALTLLAVGLRNRTLALTASAFVGVAAIRGAVIAVSQKLPIFLVIGVVALALMGLATWLSLRARRNTADASAQIEVGDPPSATSGP